MAQEVTRATESRSTRLTLGCGRLESWSMRRLKRQPAENLAATKLRDLILSGSFAPGARLLQEALADRLGVSRMPVRQALLALEREGLVKTDPWRGSIVAPLDPGVIRDMYSVRGILERHVARALAQQDSFNVSAIRATIAAGRRAIMKEDLPRLIDLDLRFHMQLYQAFKNGILLEIMRGHWIHIRRIMALTLTITEYRQQVWDEHAAILSAIEDRNAEKAGILAEAHTTAATATVIKNLARLVALNGKDNIAAG
jgi:DNA-binding GntR family transcriptional regulator